MDDSLQYLAAPVWHTRSEQYINAANPKLHPIAVHVDRECNVTRHKQRDSHGDMCNYTSRQDHLCDQNGHTGEEPHGGASLRTSNSDLVFIITCIPKTILFLGYFVPTNTVFHSNK